MDFCKKYLIIVAGISTVMADIDHELHKIINLNDAKHPPLKPWFLDDFPSYLPEASETIAHYAYTYPYDNLEHGSSYIPTYSDYLPSSSSSSDSFFSNTKKIPTEDKNYKKTISSHLTDKDTKFLKSEPNCQEIKTKETKIDGQLKPTSMTCYNCKDPKRGSTYEYCSYSSQPDKSSSDKIFESIPPRFRRSDNYQAGSVSMAYVPTQQRDEKSKTPYKFSEEYYLPDASRKFSIDHKAGESCQKVYKNSMVCSVCRNPKTGGKSEQCSQIADPNEKSYSFSTSHSIGKPKNSKKSHSKKPAPIHENTESGEQEADVLDEQPTQNVKNAAGSSDCRQVRKDSEICTVCKDPKTGGNSQRCTYNYEPDEKIYKFTRSKSFGYPESSKQQKVNDKDDKEVSGSDPEEFTTYSDDNSQDEEDYSGYENPDAYSGYESLESPSSDESSSSSSKENQNYDYNPDHVDYIRSESEKILKNADSENCRKVEKDSMVCSICKDPKTGEDSESCSYSYEPDDKKFAYSKSKSFGSPTENSDEYSGEDAYSDENSREAYATEIKPTVSYPNRKIQLTADSNTRGTVFLGEADQPEHAKVDLGLLGASQKQAKLEQLLKDDRTANRTRCKKTMKNEMTCYQCITDNGLRQEECMYIKNPETKILDNPLTSKDLKLDKQPIAAPSDDISKIKKKRRLVVKNENTTNIPLEPAAQPSRRSYRLKRQSRRKSNDNQSYEKNENSEEENYHDGYNKQKKNEHNYETDPYEYVAETQYKYDTDLGLKIPSHTLEVSDYEKEFDEIFYGNRDN